MARQFRDQLEEEAHNLEHEVLRRAAVSDESKAGDGVAEL
jgi:hypothetical protein